EIKLEPEIKVEPEIKLEPEIKVEPEIKLEPVTNKEININNQNLSINPEIFAKENNLDNYKEEINMPLIKNENINAFEIKPNLIPESEILDNKVNVIEKEKSYNNSSITQEIPKEKSEFVEEEKIVTGTNQKIITEDIKPVFIDDGKIITGADIQNHEENNTDEKVLNKSEPIVLNVDDIKSKLDKLSNSNQNNDNSDNTLNELLKQIGMENNNIISNLKDEESILLGK
ncbi:MAG: hypothetical protein PHF30_04980, partial [Bacilli bacterium]|nr:hypothetical protein [Bacilli bacterium]